MQMKGSELSAELLRPVSPLRRIVELVDDSRDASDRIPLFRKLQSPPRSGRFTPATSGRETSQTPQHVTQSDSGRASVGRLPPGQAVAANENVGRSHGAN